MSTVKTDHLKSSEEYSEHLKKLRKQYPRGTPNQRLGIAIQRVEGSVGGPTLLVDLVSALEGFLRAVILFHTKKSKHPSNSEYESVKHDSAPVLFEAYLELKKLNIDEVVEGDARNEYLKRANEYRNLLAHECTYLNASTLRQMCLFLLDLLIAVAEREQCKSAHIGSLIKLRD